MFSQSVGTIRNRDRGRRRSLACTDHCGSPCQRFRETARAAGGIVAENRLGCFNHATVRTCLCGCDFESDEWATGFGANANATELPRLLTGIGVLGIGQKTKPNLAEIFAATELPDVSMKLTQSSRS
jgi:hypothetical protein